MSIGACAHAHMATGNDNPEEHFADSWVFLQFNDPAGTEPLLVTEPGSRFAAVTHKNCDVSYLQTKISTMG